MRMIVVVTGLLACTAGTEPRFPVWEGAPGVIYFSHDGPAVTVPDSFLVGVPDTVTVLTYGGGCVSGGYTESDVDGLLAVVRPIDNVVVRAPANHACTDILLEFRHEAALTFGEAGTATIRFVGLHSPADTLYTVTRTVPVLHADGLSAVRAQGDARR
jgi:hypothetical protein